MRRTTKPKPRTQQRAKAKEKVDRLNDLHRLAGSFLAACENHMIAACTAVAYSRNGTCQVSLNMIESALSHERNVREFIKIVNLPRELQKGAHHAK